MIDLHTHLLPGVDDGSPSAAQSLSVLARFAAQGVTAVCCTPHLRASDAGAAPCAELDRALASLVAEAESRPLPPGAAWPRLVRGFEIMLDVPAPVFADRCLALGGTRYVLVEFQRLVPAEASVRVLKGIVAQGLVPVLAHPERYASCSLEQATAWRDAGAALQVDATTLLADSRRAERARVIVQAGLASLIASDNHGDSRTMASAVEWLESHGGRPQAQLLAVDNPAAILADRPLTAVPAVRFRRSWYTALKDFVVGGREA